MLNINKLKTMKKATLTVLTIISLASCTKEYVRPSHVQNDGKEIQKPKTYEGNWLLNYSNSALTYHSEYTASTFKNDSIVFNYRFENGNYILDTNGVDTYQQRIKILLDNQMEWNQLNLIDGTSRTLYFTK